MKGGEEGGGAEVEPRGWLGAFFDRRGGNMTIWCRKENTPQGRERGEGAELPSFG
jgi:hypothetical protein